MEYYKGNVLANVACGTSTRWQAKWDSSTKAISSLGANWSSSFHVWRMDWDDQKIDLYLDDTLMNSVALSSMLNADGSSPFKQKAYMILNLAIGGDNGGDPSATTFPQQYLVDYVRVYQKL
jgi:beta-glucanase (GH16 family)